MTARRVLLYSDGPMFSGAERYLLELIRGLPRDRYAPELVVSEEGAVDAFAAEAAALGTPVFRLPAIPTLKARGEFRKVVRFFATRAPRRIHFNLTDPRSCNGAMVAARFGLRRRFAVTEHLPGSPFDGKALPFRHRIALRSTALTIVNSPPLKALVEARPLNRSRVVVVPNGISDSGEPTAERRAVAWERLEITDPELLVVGLVGRLVPQKNPDLFLEGARRIIPEMPRVRFLVIGDGPEFTGLNAKVAEFGLGSGLRFCGQRTDVRELLYGLDLLVNTSHYEGQPLAILEAMMAGVPTLATDIPGMRDLVIDGVSGRIVAGEDGDALGDALRDLLHHPEKLRLLGRVARERAVVLHSCEALGEETARHYDAIFGAGNPPPRAAPTDEAP